MAPVKKEPQEQVETKPSAAPVDTANEFAFEGGPTKAEVEKWKKTCGHIYMTRFDDGAVYLWRPLTRQEWRRIRSTQGADQLYQEEEICQLCVVWPKWDAVRARSIGMAGTPSTLADQIIDRSGFTPSNIQPISL